MGAWGIGNFDNDDAADWIYDLEKSKSKTLLHKTLATVTDSEYPEAPECCEALAAAEVILAGLTGDGSNLPEEARKWLAAKTGLIVRKSKGFDSADAQQACTAVKQIVVNSELADLFGETEDGEAWQRAQEQLAKRLESHA